MNRRGNSLLEVMVGTALAAILLVVLLKLLGMAIIMAENILIKIEMREEAVFVVELLEHDMNEAEKIVLSEHGNAVSITKNGDVLYYRLDEQKKEGRITKNTQPLTGENTQLEISFRQFLLTPVSDNAVKLELQIVNPKTAQAFELETIIPCTKLRTKIKKG